MQRLDPEKRATICKAAARLFATRPFHEVRLGDVAAAASVGKGTLYVYFDSKESLYFALIHEGFAELVARLRAQLEADRGPALRALETIVHELVEFAVHHPDLFELMRSIGKTTDKSAAAMTAQRAALAKLIEQTIRRGVRRGELRDAHPELTALCIPGLVRSVFLFGPKNLDAKKITTQLSRLLAHGLTREKKA